jgi:hypothetical protein
MTQVHTVAAGSAACVKEEWFPLLVSIQYLIELPEHVPLKRTAQSMRPVTYGKRTFRGEGTRVASSPSTFQIGPTTQHQLYVCQIGQRVYHNQLLVVFHPQTLILGRPRALRLVRVGSRRWLTGQQVGLKWRRRLIYFARSGYYRIGMQRCESFCRD